MPYEAKDIKKDLDRKLASLPENEQMQFIADLWTVNSRCNTNTQWNDAIDDWITDFFMPQDREGKLDKGLFEKRWERMTDFLTEQAFELGQAKNWSEPHGANWKLEYLYAHSPQSLYTIVREKLGTMSMSDEKELLTQAYGADDSLSNSTFILGRNLENSIKKRRENATAQEKSILDIGTRFFPGAPEDTALEKSTKKIEAPYPKQEILESRDAFLLKAADQIDFSFIRDETAAQTLRTEIRKGAENQTEGAKSSLTNLSEQLDAQLAYLNSDACSTLTDSSQMKAVKKGIQALQKRININGSGTPENRQALADAYNFLRQACNAYLEERKGLKGKKSSARYEAIRGLMDGLDENQDVFSNMIIQDQQVQEQKKAAEPKPGPGMAELLVMAENDLSLQAVRQPDEATKDLLAQAESRINAAREELEGPAEGILERGEKMADIVGKCSGALAAIDVRGELLKSLGFANPETMTEEQIKAELSSHENGRQDAINDFLSDFSLHIGKISKELHSGPLQELRAAMEKDGRWTNTFANAKRAEKAMTDGLEAEVRWKQLREDYATGEQLDIQEAAANREAVAVQRNLIMKNGGLASQSLYRTEMIRQIPGNMVKLMNWDPAEAYKRNAELYEDFRDILDDKTIDDVMSGADLGARIKINVASAAVEYARKTSSHGEAFGYDTKDLNAKREHGDLGKAFGIDHFERDTEFVQVAIMNKLAEGYSLGEIMDDPELSKQAGDDLRDIMRANPNYGEKRVQLTDHLDNTKAFFDKLWDGFAKQTIPGGDLSDPIERAAYADELYVLENMQMSLTHEKESLRRRKDYLAKFTPQELEKREQLDNAGELLSCFAHYDNASEQASIRIKTSYYMEKGWGSQLPGLSIGTVGAKLEDMPVDVGIVGMPATLGVADLAKEPEKAKNILWGRERLDVSSLEAKCTQAIPDFGKFAGVNFRDGAAAPQRQNIAPQRQNSNEKKPDKVRVTIGDVVAAEKNESAAKKAETRLRSKSVSVRKPKSGPTLG